MTSQIAVLMDGSNLLGALSRLKLGYPNLARLIDLLVGSDSLAYAKFYGAPPVNAPAGIHKMNYYPAWMRFVDANRKTPGLTFYRGYREKDGKEKAVDVALAVDLIHDAHRGAYQRVALVGGDGDHQYAVEIAKDLGDLTVVVIEGQRYAGMQKTGVKIREISRVELVSLNICAEGRLSPVPI